MTDFLKEAMQARIVKRDEEHIDPNERALFVNSLIFHALNLDNTNDVIKQPLFWDLVCFSVELINAFALGTDQDELLLLVKTLNKTLYSFHYSVETDHEIMGPTKEEHRKIWEDRINQILKHRND